MKKILVATEKPFSKVAVDKIRAVVEGSGNQLVLCEKYKTEEELLAAVADVDALIIRSDIVNDRVVEAAKNLKIVVRAGAGYDNVDLQACSAKGIVVMNTPGQNANAVAELVFGLLIFSLRKHFNGSSGSELRGNNIGIHAYGNIGRYVAKIAAGFGMNVYAYDPFVPAEQMKEEGVIPVSSVEELYKTCRIVSLHIPATEQTKRSVNKALLSLMPEGAILVNTARKEVINEEELVEVMEKRPDFIYLSDIVPGNVDHFKGEFEGRYFFTAKKMGAQTEEANVNAGVAAANQIVKYFATGDETFRVNP
ncbi:NAD(P)-dependent oxidoreductase [Xiashengella succiniciproducens]|uniref:NAD(P)-binding domain-containing protein n=1 Tax=Xiashengella succiniciproducens TaxID=2949635 RepID=A0A9J6ZM54_9BACT|nr:NAD(P)-dependent oxidoreductase [Alkaliflexus sp. Ai-910]MDI9539142.1 NAD(P)-dependent oxidoreductase [Bacteroidota bacterium]URW78559.1 NAD(P)-binding domain-containing protein [Alkaliflexus sp. Ai-910]HHU00846.1 3-phosphoglycerate dehydrogenase [Bacteroidales bacterium]